MNSKPILEILELIGVTFDETGEEIITTLDKEGAINENILAENMDLRINDVRKVLYKLMDLGFAKYIKEKDEEKKWWYVYKWCLEKSKIHYRYITHIRAKLHENERQLLAEQEYVFECKKCKHKYTYAEALEGNFFCSECDGVVKEVKNKKLMMELSKKIKLLLEEMNKEEEIARKNREEEMKLLQEIEDKEKLAEEKAKARKKKATAKKLAIEKAAKLKAKPKKTVKKKTVKKSVKKAPIKKKPTKVKAKKKKAPIRKMVKKITKKPIKKVVKKPIKKKK
jgi:transcription initiation factor TFIIE subunit alpha